MSAPTCRGCGKPLAKYSRTKFISDWEGTREDDHVVKVDVLPKTVEEAQKLFNLQIISSKRYRNKDGISSVGLWDGESYGLHGEGLFCTKECGYALGRAYARYKGGRLVQG